MQGHGKVTPEYMTDLNSQIVCCSEEEIMIPGFWNILCNHSQNSGSKFQTCIDSEQANPVSTPGIIILGYAGLRAIFWCCHSPYRWSITFYLEDGQYVFLADETWHLDYAGFGSSLPVSPRRWTISLDCNFPHLALFRVQSACADS